MPQSLNANRMVYSGNIAVIYIVRRLFISDFISEVTCNIAHYLTCALLKLLYQGQLEVSPGCSPAYSLYLLFSTAATMLSVVYTKIKQLFSI